MSDFLINGAARLGAVVTDGIGSKPHPSGVSGDGTAKAIPSADAIHCSLTDLRGCLGGTWEYDAERKHYALTDPSALDIQCLRHHFRPYNLHKLFNPTEKVELNHEQVNMLLDIVKPRTKKPADASIIEHVKQTIEGLLKGNEGLLRSRNQLSPLMLAYLREKPLASPEQPSGKLARA